MTRYIAAQQYLSPTGGKGLTGLLLVGDAETHDGAGKILARKLMMESSAYNITLERFEQRRWEPVILLDIGSVDINDQEAFWTLYDNDPLLHAMFQLGRQYGAAEATSRLEDDDIVDHDRISRLKDYPHVKFSPDGLEIT